MTLPYDTARCANAACPLECRRKEPGDPIWQVTTTFPGGNGCHGFIPAGQVPVAQEGK